MYALRLIEDALSRSKRIVDAAQRIHESGTCTQSTFLDGVRSSIRHPYLGMAFNVYESDVRTENSAPSRTLCVAKSNLSQLSSQPNEFPCPTDTILVEDSHPCRQPLFLLTGGPCPSAPCALQNKFLVEIMLSPAYGSSKVGGTLISDWLQCKLAALPRRCLPGSFDPWRPSNGGWRKNLRDFSRRKGR